VVITPVATPSVSSPSQSSYSISGSRVAIPLVIPSISTSTSGLSTPPVEKATTVASTKSFGSQVLDNINHVATAVVKTANVIVDSPGSKTIQTTGFFAGLVASAILYTETGFAAPIATSEMVLIPVRMWGFLLMGLGIKKRSKPWGTVYDSVTKQPIDPAIVTARDESGKVVAESITDIDGRYGFLLPDGTYYISVKKTNYEFPSKKMGGKSFDELYSDLYFGEPVTIQAGQVLDKNIPMDQKGFDWNEASKKERNAMLFHSKHEKPVAIISDYVYGLGLLISVIVVITRPSMYDISVLVAYSLVLVFLKFDFKKKPGRITIKDTNQPLSYAIVRVTTTDHMVTLRSGVSDAQGRYYCIVPKGEYLVDIEKKNADGSYSKVYESPKISSTSGIINTNFVV
jgi:hypothetical protein